MYHVTIMCLAVSVAAFPHQTAGQWQSGSSNVSVRFLNMGKGPQLEVVQLSPSSGYIQTPGWGNSSKHPGSLKCMVLVDVPENHTLMVTVIHKNLTGSWRVRCHKHTAVLIIYEFSLDNLMWHCRNHHVERLRRKRLSQGADLCVDFIAHESNYRPDFRLFFSVEISSRMLQPVSEDGLYGLLWNCSVPNFADFKLHFQCDMYPQCVNKEDERHCPYFSEECGLGLVAINDQCFSFHMNFDYSTWIGADQFCRKRGGILGRLRKRDTLDKVLQYLKPWDDVWGYANIAVGLHSPPLSLPFMYRRELQYSDGAIAFERWTVTKSLVSVYCGMIRGDLPANGLIEVGHCSGVKQDTSAMCEIPKDFLAYMTSVNSHPINFSIPTSKFSRHQLIPCPDNDVTHAFLACDTELPCWSRDTGQCAAPLTPLPPSFTCANGFESVPYTLVCDFRPDCRDSSDENFCEFQPCDLPEPFHCSDHECVPRNTVCNMQKNCYDGIDEDLCADRVGSDVPEKRGPPPAVAYLTAQGVFDFRTVVPYVCPETHFQCPDNGFCMPGFVRCNDVFDCLGREDEADCDSYSCPHYYRCRGSRVCLHPEYLCDDIIQCPQNDDELFCGLTCPENCTCYGLVFHCRQTFHAEGYKKLRFLDGRGSGMKFSELAENTMLIHLSLAQNGLSTVGVLRFPNMHSLNLNDNQLTEIQLYEMRLLSNLKILSLSGNPLVSVWFSSSGETSGTTRVNSPEYSKKAIQEIAALSYQTKTGYQDLNGTLSNETSCQGLNTRSISSSLQILDLSRAELKVLNSVFFNLLPNLRTVNLSGSRVHTLLGEGFQALTKLRELDLRGCPLTYFPRNTILGLDQLQTVYSENYKLCCPAMLPDGFVLKNCYAPSDDISSCNDLLRSNSYRIFLSIFAFLSLLGNTSSLVYRVLLRKKKALLSYDVFVAHLCIADFFMGLYLSLIGVADNLYQGTFLWEDITWKQSAACHLAGFLSLVSSEVSALVICLITFDRFLVLRFPFSTFHFRAHSANVISLCVWGIGCLIAGVPLTPGVAHWQFYSQTGICIPLPISRPDSPGYSYAFGVMIMANFIFFIIISAGQVSIYWSVQDNSLSSGDTTRKLHDLTIARRLITVAISDFFCWFPIGLLGILATTGTPISGEVNVAMAIFVLPINSALNPFLYTLNILLEKRRKMEEERIKKRLMSQFQSAGIHFTTKS